MGCGLWSRRVLVLRLVFVNHLMLTDVCLMVSVWSKLVVCEVPVVNCYFGFVTTLKSGKTVEDCVSGVTPVCSQRVSVHRRIVFRRRISRWGKRWKRINAWLLVC
ncbi:hypothetical protein Bca4012_019417 [Brassica carinata]